MSVHVQCVPSRRVRGAWLAAHALLLFSSFPHPLSADARAQLDLGGLLAWVAPAPLLLGLRGLAPRRAALAAGLATWAAHTAILHWIWIVTVVYGGAPAALGLLAPPGLALWAALWGALFGAGCAALTRAGRARAGSLAALWVCCEWARGTLLGGFPWATLGYALHRDAWLLPLAAWTGVYGLSFAALAVGAALAQAGARWRSGENPLRPLAAIALGLALLHGAGAALRAAQAPDPPQTIRVAVLQGNIEQGLKWSPDWYEETLRAYEELSRRAARDGAQLVVWPETALPALVDSGGRGAERVAALARETGAAFVVGAVGIEARPDAPPAYFDSAFAFDAQGALRARYDKSHLVPFGEFVPFAELLGRFLQAIARGLSLSGATPGPGPRAIGIALPQGPVLNAGVPICYELLFPDLVRRFARDGAEIFLAITNDAWYGRTGAPLQFLAMTALRSAENGVWTLRAANTGVSAIIDASGQVRQRTGIFERALLVADVPRRGAAGGATFYARHGDVFVGLCALALAGSGLAGRRASARRSRRDG